MWLELVCRLEEDSLLSFFRIVSLSPWPFKMDFSGVLLPVGGRPSVCVLPLTHESHSGLFRYLMSLLLQTFWCSGSLAASVVDGDTESIKVMGVYWMSFVPMKGSLSGKKWSGYTSEFVTDHTVGRERKKKI